MQITSIVFVFLFLPLSLVSYTLVPNKLKEYMLLFISLFFYALGSLEYFMLFISSIFINIILGRTMNILPDEGIRRKILLILGITYNVVILGWYKYYDFVLQIGADFFGIKTEARNVLLPLGISFFVFKAISYLIDIYDGSAKLDSNLAHDALYLSLFTQIQSGPLTRYNEMKKDGVMPKSIMKQIDLFSDGVLRLMIGFNKKILISNILSNVVNEIFTTSLDVFTAPYAWLGAICYSLQLYFDFSGYSDMAIGITEMFGYRCIENFNYPYMTESISKFWRRWHISLGNWFRDYVYIRLGGSRSGKWHTYRNLLIVWILTGIWHGASYNYIVWGLGYFGAISFEKMTHLPERIKKKSEKIIYRLFTLLFVILQWIVFRADNLSYGLGYIKKMFVWNINPLTNSRTLFLLKDNFIFILVAVILCFPIVPWIRRKVSKSAIACIVYEIVFAVIILSLFILSLSFVISGQNNPFAYANF